jgi:hypothetical protein
MTMNECDLRVTEYQLGFLTAMMHQYKMNCYDDQELINLCKDLIWRLAKAREMVEKGV